MTEQALDGYNIVGQVDLGYWITGDYEENQKRLSEECQQLYREQYDDRDRIVFVYTGDVFVDGHDLGLAIRNLQVTLNEQDISNYFVHVLSTNTDILNIVARLADISTDPVPITASYVIGDFKSVSTDKHPKSQKETYQYGSSNPIKIGVDQLNSRERFLLTESKTFCMYPWIHMHAYPTGEAWPCCHAEMQVGSVGSCRDSTLMELANSDRMRELRSDMLNEKENSYCTRCYEQEKSGFFSGRQSANKHHGHHIQRVADTESDGSYNDFKMTYWDIRFSNLCNLRCRSCGHIFSSQWYQDQAKLTHDEEWAKNTKPLFYAGRTETDMWEQLIPHLDYVEQIYFAGGEPLMMEEHYHILEELERRGRFDVRLIYNTNFTHVKLKDRSVFDYWKKFKNVAVGASLDAMGERAEYIRKGTDWAQVEENRQRMLEICPEVDFYISPTLSIMNVMHLPDFHKNWVDRGLIRAQDLNVNVLQDPVYYRIDIAPQEYKDKIKEKYREHIAWLEPQDKLRRATVGFESALNFMNASDRTDLIDTFWRKTHELDSIRRESLLTVIPELVALQ